MHWIKRLQLLAVCFFIASCGDVGSRQTLPFPTPAQHDLVVLTQPGLLTYSTDDNGNPTGLEYDLAQAFAQELGVAVKFEVVEPDQPACSGTTITLLPPGSRQHSPPTFRRRRPSF